MTEIREMTKVEIEPYIRLLEENGFTPEIDQGVWLGAFEDDRVAGWVRIFDENGDWMLEDVFVLEDQRRRGLATELIDAARRNLDHLWLICDDEMIGYYEARGFGLSPKPDFPAAFVTIYAAKHEWPTGSDHNHNAMIWRRS